MIERFVWRLDCRLKYICYLLVIKFVIFDYFWGKIRLFLGSLWRALQSGNSPVDFVLAFVFFYLSIKNKRKQEQNERLVWRCEWFEGYLPPIVKYLKHNTFQLYALKNTLFYVLLLLLIPECNEFNKILGFHKIWKKCRGSPKFQKS